jgi:molybdopterin converting factor small subunit
MIKVITFAGAAELAGCDSLELDLQLPVSAAEIKRTLVQVCPPLEKLVPHSRLAVDGEYVQDSTVITEYQEIALIPPVSGG